MPISAHTLFVPCLSVRLIIAGGENTQVQDDIIYQQDQQDVIPSKNDE